MSNITKLDMHVHTEHSPDSDTKLTTIHNYLQKHPNMAFCILDHNRVAGAIQLKAMLPNQIIVGEEIKTSEGEVAGLFLEEKIPRGKSVDWTMDAISEQGGIIYVPHPLDRMRTSKLTSEGLNTAIKKAHILEVFNARNIFGADDKKANILATDMGILKGCGSDAHTAFELGHAYMQFETPLALEPTALLEGLAQAKPVARRSFLGVHFITKYKKMTMRSR